VTTRKIQDVDDSTVSVAWKAHKILCFTANLYKISLECILFPFCQRSTMKIGPNTACFSFTRGINNQHFHFANVRCYAGRSAAWTRTEVPHNEGTSADVYVNNTGARVQLLKCNFNDTIRVITVSTESHDESASYGMILFLCPSPPPQLEKAVQQRVNTVRLWTVWEISPDMTGRRFFKVSAEKKSGKEMRCQNENGDKWTFWRRFPRRIGSIRTLRGLRGF